MNIWEGRRSGGEV